MRILYLAHRIPYPPNKGDKIRSFNELKYLSKSHKIDLACLADNHADSKYEKDLNKYCSKICIVSLNRTKAKLKSVASLINNKPLSVAYFYSPSLQSTIDRWLSSNPYDIAICFSSPMADYLFRAPFFATRFSAQAATRNAQLNKLNEPNKLAIRNSQLETPTLIMDFCDVDSDKWLQYSKQTPFPINLVYKIESRRLFKYEKRINFHFDHSVFVSQQEANLFTRLYPEARNVSVVPNGVDHEYFSPDSVTSHFTTDHGPATTRHGQHMLLFTGAMDYYANADGVTWFCNEIFPMVKREFPESQFFIVGSNPRPSVRDLADNNGVRVTGFVEDIRLYYQTADVFVAPLRLARGVQNKVLEAMAMQKAVVTTSKAIEGIMAVRGDHLLVEDSPQDFSDAVSKLLQDQKARKRLGEKAQAFVKVHYDWSNNMKKLDILLQQDGSAMRYHQSAKSPNSSNPINSTNPNNSVGG